MKTRKGSNGLEDTYPPSIKYNATMSSLPTASSSPGSTSSGDKSSVCQSPSWEAYDRRKKEKKEEKRGREDAKATQKPNRLCKPPPFASPYAYAQRNGGFQSDTAVFNAIRKPRPMSTIDLTSPQKEAEMYRQPRSRTGSFTSLFKAPFGLRRSSIDQSNAEDAAGFVGGIKLEMERHDTNQVHLDYVAKRDEADIHPALRKVQSDQRCSSALKSPPPPARETSKEPKDPNRRAYPPITRMTAKVKTRSMVSPTAPAVPDLSTIEKWRARMGLKPSYKKAGVVPRITKSQIGAPQDARKSVVEETPSSFDDTKQTDDLEVPPSNDPETRMLTPPPPQPPRRSSKRTSMVIPALSIPADVKPNIPISRLMETRKTSSIYDPEATTELNIKAPSLSPSWDDLQTSVMNTIEKNVRPIQDEQAGKEQGKATQEAEKAFWNNQEWAESRAAYPSPGHSSSSDDSASEGFHSLTAPSTPNTSRPQSEKGFPRYTTEIDEKPLPRVSLYDKEFPDDMASLRSAAQSRATLRDSRDQFDPIHAAAMKVMAAFPEMKKECQNSTDVLNMAHAPLRLTSKDTKHSSLPSKLGANKEPVAKVFVECCGCKYYHDMPSRLYEAMANPSATMSAVDKAEFAGSAAQSVKCPWCKHGMTTSCCAGFAAMVYVKEQLH